MQDVVETEAATAGIRRPRNICMFAAVSRPGRCGGDRAGGFGAGDGRDSSVLGARGDVRDECVYLYRERDGEIDGEIHTYVCYRYIVYLESWVVHSHI